MTPHRPLDALDAPDAFDALDATLRREAAARARTCVDDARRDADARTARARADADVVVARARRDGEATADAILVRERAEVRRECASIVLVARRDVLDELRERVVDAVLTLRDASEYSLILDGLEARVRTRLGSGAHIVRDPERGGGVLGRLDGCRVDETLVALAERAFDDVASRIEELWR